LRQARGRTGEGQGWGQLCLRDKVVAEIFTVVIDFQE
jgi:hypothetical protein